MRETMAAPVGSIATRNVICVNVNDDMSAVARVLAEHRLKKAPVLDGERMVGIINRSNITGYAVRHYPERGTRLGNGTREHRRARPIRPRSGDLKARPRRKATPRGRLSG